MTMTAHTPMMMPSMVRNVRILLLRMFLIAIWKVSSRLMPPPPLQRAWGHHGLGVMGVAVVDHVAVLQTG